MVELLRHETACSVSIDGLPPFQPENVKKVGICAFCRIVINSWDKIELRQKWIGIEK